MAPKKPRPVPLNLPSTGEGQPSINADAASEWVFNIKRVFKAKITTTIIPAHSGEPGYGQFSEVSNLSDVFGKALLTKMTGFLFFSTFAWK